MSSAAPRMVPTTIPAIAPPDNPELWFVDAALAALAEAVGLDVDVDEGKSGGMEVKLGNVTPGHRLSTLDSMQHESVAFGELDAQ